MFDVKYKVGDNVRVRIDLVPYEVYGNLTFFDGNMSKCAGQICTISVVLSDKKYYVSENPFAWSEEMLEPADSKTLLIFENGSSIKALSQKDDTVRGENHFCTGFEAPYLDLSVFLNDGISAKNGGKNSMKFTFYVKEGTRVDKTCNKLIPTITTFITAESYGDSTYHGAATCDKADYNERQGCLEALANAMLGGNFDRDFNRAVKANEFADKKKRTCTYCGKVFDTVEEKQAEEAWHVERRKARHERYLLRKRAKEIAFEEQAQKMAKEIIAEDNKK